LVPVVHWQVWSKQGYLAGSDEERANALVEVFDDPGIAAVVCANGGYGCTRLLELLPPSRLGAHNLPRKRFFGFSDITALHRYLTTNVYCFFSVFLYI
jgi:muramoyltetrapeptide carboxypeptidase